MSKVIIKKDSGYADCIRKYKIILNGKEVGKIANGGTQEFDVPLGENELFLKIDWCRSNKIHFECQQDGVEQFECGSNLRGIKVLFSIIYLFMPHKWIWLKNASNNRINSETQNGAGLP